MPSLLDPGFQCLHADLFLHQACTYASDVCPTQLRAYLTTYVNLCWVIGQIIASGVLKGLVEREDDWAFRIPFALQWVREPVLRRICLAHFRCSWR